MKIKRSLFFRSLILLKEKPKNLLFIFLFDILFFVLLLLLGNLLLSRLPTTEIGIQNFVSEVGLWPIFLLLIIYYLIALLLHSSIKLLIINQISEIKVNLSNIIKFYLKNLIFYIISLLFILLTTLIIYNVIDFIFKQEIVQILLLIFFVFIFSITYTFVSISQFLSAKKPKIHNVLKKSLDITFHKFLFPPTILSILVILAYLFRNFPFVQIPSIILAFFLILVNRAYFYLLTKNVST